MHGTRSGGDCDWISTTSGFVEGCYLPQDLSSVSRCKEALSVEAIGWVEFGLCLLTVLATCMWMRTSKRSYVSGYTRLA